jgi:hypothetical protein
MKNEYQIGIIIECRKQFDHFLSLILRLFFHGKLFKVFLRLFVYQ